MCSRSKDALQGQPARRLFLHAALKTRYGDFPDERQEKHQKSEKMVKKVQDMYLMTKNRTSFLCKIIPVFFQYALAELEKSCIMVDIPLLR